ncbi:MAG: multicopper oxidase family protein [Gemmatimonadales bacterium]|nr:MAG: multicopper oxidase family protein [Gemmatimonadales bacterium]
MTTPGPWAGMLVAAALGAGTALGLPPGAAAQGAPGAGAGTPAAAESFPCDLDRREHALQGLPSPEDRCIRLYPGTAAPEASGWVRLLPAPTPFGTAVDRNGVHLFRFEVEAEGLPDPGELGPYTRYVAWITPPTLSPMVALGEVEEGRSRLDVGGFNTFLFLVSAEGPAPVDERTGPLMLRGISPAMILRPHDIPVILAEMTPGEGHGDLHGHHHHPATPQDQAHRHDPDRAHDPDPARAHPHQHDVTRTHLHDPAAHPHHVPAEALPAGLVSQWRAPAMHPQVSMPHEIMRLRPRVSPFLPGELGAPSARASEVVRVADGDTLVLEAGPVTRTVDGSPEPGWAFNGQIPGPRIEADQGSTLHVVFRNHTPLPAAVHWHGLRLDWRSDGVPGVTQDPVPPGESFYYDLHFPDEGVFWYHPHLREDVMQDMGMAGTILVRPPTPDAADREVVLVLDDHLVGPEGPVPYGREAPIHAIMGRFGNVLTVNGAPRWEVTARAGETLRLHLQNVSSTRSYNLSAGGPAAPLPLRLVGSDVGVLPRSVHVESAVVAPAERWTVELHLPREGTVVLENRVQGLDHLGARFFPRVDTLGVIRVEGPPVAQAAEREREFAAPRSDAGLVAEVEALARRHRARPPDHTLILELEVGDLPFPLDPLLGWEATYRPPVEWEGTMPDMDWLVSGDMARWGLRDAVTGHRNMEIDWRFQVGEEVKLRLVNDRNGLHPMHHPIHLHGQRFLVTAVDGEEVEHLAWKDTVLVPVGSTVDLVVEMTNPGPWMIHCHISEHLEAGMMAVFHVGDVHLGGEDAADSHGEHAHVGASSVHAPSDPE